MRFVRLAALGVAAYLAFLAVMVPAGFVAARVEGETRGVLRLEDAHGTLWRGQARAVVSGAPGPHIQWRFLPARLGAARLGFEVQVNEPQLKGAAELGRSLRAWQAHELALDGNAAALAALFPLAAAWRPEGTVSVRAPAVSWNDQGIDGEGRLEWRAAAIALSDVKPLGTYRAQLRGEGAEARIELATLDGPLRLAGTGALSPQGTLRFTGEARAEGPQSGALQPLLDLLGPRRPDGARTLAVGVATPAR